MSEPSVKRSEMKLTNRLGLPDAIVQAVRNDTYDRGDADISITGLLHPPRIEVLTKLHEGELEQDVSDRIWSLCGQAMHTVLERANRRGIAEQRLSMRVEGWKVSGGMDLFDEAGILTDYKFTSVWKVVKGDTEDWVNQLNLYSVLLRHHGHDIKGLQIIALLRDWSKHEAQRDPTYPQAQVVNIEIPLWEPGAAEAFMRYRVIAHQRARLELPECGPKDRWQKDDVWAVMKPGRKSAVRLYPVEADAVRHVADEKGTFIVKRPGVSTRCELYCGVSKFCTQFKAMNTQSQTQEVST